MTVYGVSFDLVGKQPIVLLKTQDGNTFLPIWIGHPEAAAILMNLQGTEPPRPMTHDLATSIIASLDAEIRQVTVTELRDNTFHALITIVRNGTEIELDARTSDAIALALRTRREDLRRRRRDRGVGRRVRGRRGGGLAPPHGPGVARRPRSRRVPPLPRHRLARRVRRRARGRRRRTTASAAPRRRAAPVEPVSAPELLLRQVEQLRHEPVEPGGRERPGVRRRERSPAAAARGPGRRCRARAAPSAPTARSRARADG